MTTPVWRIHGKLALMHGSALGILPQMGAGQYDAIVTDPPYGLEFMGKGWDSFRTGDGFRRSRNPADAQRDSVFGRASRTGPEYTAGRAFQEWCLLWATEAYRVLKPGGHLVAFGGTRTYHRLACAIEDAGFEIRDSLHWIAGSGFPKSLNVSKDARVCQCDMRGVQAAVPDLPPDAAAGEVPDLLPAVQRAGEGPGVGETRPQGGSGAEDVHAAVRPGQSSLEGRGDAQAPQGELHGRPVREVPAGVPGDGPQGRLHHGAPAGDGPVGGQAPDPGGSGESQGPQPGAQRPGQPGAVPDQRGPQAGRGWPVCGGCGKPVVPRGLGTALKPAHEPIILARKPLEGTVVGNVLAHGTGALNTAGSTTAAGRWPPNVIFTHDPACVPAGTRQVRNPSGSVAGTEPSAAVKDVYAARERVAWQAHGQDGTETVAAYDCAPGCPVAELDTQSGHRSEKARVLQRNGARQMDGWGMAAPTQAAIRGDAGGASRFFPCLAWEDSDFAPFRYQAKAPKSERPVIEIDGKPRSHPTVKPVALMRWLIRLVTPPGGVILDPFAGTGTTGAAALAEGMRCVLIEQHDSDEHPYIRMARQRLGLDGGPVLR